MNKRSIPQPTYAASLPPAPSRATRSRTYEQAHPTTSYRLPPELRDQVTQLARSLNVPVSDLARALLEFALAAHAEGILPLTPVIRSSGHTLHPKD